MTPFARDGHLHDLGVELLLSRDLDPADQQPVARHLASCADCARRVAAARADDSLAAPVRVRLRSRAWVAAPIAAALAALVLLAIRAPPGDLTPKGTGLALEVFRDQGETSARLGWNDRVQPGDRLGFRLRSTRPGRVLVLGVDSTGRVYPCWPVDGVASEVEPSGDPRDLPAAIRLDDTPGAERLVALRCDGAFSLDEIAGALSDRASSAGAGEAVPPLQAGCVQDEVRLVKETR